MAGSAGRPMVQRQKACSAAGCGSVADPAAVIDRTEVGYFAVAADAFAAAAADSMAESSEAVVRVHPGPQASKADQKPDWLVD